MSIENILKEKFNKETILFNEPMKNHITFKVGGNTDYLLLPSNSSEIKDGIKICKENNIPLYIIGNGSNVLVKDKGFRGMIIKISERMKKCEVKDNLVFAETGILLKDLSEFIYMNELKGFEFASGIPGTLGGGIYMNAGAYGGEIKDVLLKATILNPKTFEIKEYSNEELEFEYRNSNVQKKELIVLNATLKLEKGNKEDIKQLIDELTQKRIDKQPLEYPSAGSTFKRPEGYFAGKLIMDSNLRGYKLGGAQISEKHCGFVINSNNATAQDILDLIQHVQDTVFQKFNVNLEKEVRVIGE